MLVQHFLCTGIPLCHKDVIRLQRNKVACQCSELLRAGGNLKNLVALFLEHINDVIRHLRCMNKDLVMTNCVHNTINVDVAIRLLHMINSNAHTLKLSFNLLIAAAIAA